MKLWTLKTEDERLAELGRYAGNVGYNVHLREYGEEFTPSVTAFLEKYVLRCVYSWTYEDDDRDDGPVRGGGTVYQEIMPERLIVQDGGVVGVTLVQIEHSHMSSAFHYICRALYVGDAPDKSVFFEGGHCGSHTSEDGDARYTLCERSAIPEGAKHCGANEHLFSEPHMY